jgi:MerR family transcriptional regulator, mercuric resistance operon regulatory protein
MVRITIGKLAAATGLKVTTIRYYERAGLMPPPVRTAGRQRSYAMEDQRRLLLICKARELKFGIEEIRILLDLAQPTRTSCRDIQHLAITHLKKLREEITGLMKLEVMLAGATARCSDGAAQPCPILELLSPRANSQALSSFGNQPLEPALITIE